MKYLPLLFILTACNNSEPMTSGKLRAMAQKECKNVPELDMQQMMCQYSFIMGYCKINDPDIKLCESLREK